MASLFKKPTTSSHPAVSSPSSLAALTPSSTFAAASFAAASAASFAASASNPSIFLDKLLILILI